MLLTEAINGYIIESQAENKSAKTIDPAMALEAVHRDGGELTARQDHSSARS